jgi:hypothetical protein
LAYTDRYMTRAFEDACDSGEIDATQLPQATRDRLAARKAARLTLAS